MPLISILMPVYNTASFLEDCLDSILAQEEQDWELLAVNDGSTDQSGSILQKYAQRDPRIKVFTNDGKGIITALRLALQQSSGSLITRMDSDDRMSPQKLNLLRAHLLQAGKGYLATGLVDYFSSQTLGDGYRRYQTWLNQLTLTSDNYSDIYKECVLPSPCWMCHREDLLACGAFDPDSYPEDYDLCFRFYKKKLQVIGIPQVLHYWRDYPARTSRTDPNYADQYYLDLKMRYFLEIDYEKGKNLFLWGAGKKGKYLAKRLQAKQIPFRWLTNNPRKIGHDIYGIKLEDVVGLNAVQQPQIILSVAGPEDQKEILDFMAQRQWKKGIDFFAFC